MRERGMLIAWAALVVAFALLLLYEVNKWQSLASEGARAASERQRLTVAIRATEEQIVTEMRNNAALLQEMQWTAAGGDPSAFLTRLAELAAEKRMRVMAIGALERQATPQFNKSWHVIQVVAPYREVRELAARVEGEKGILEDLRLDVPPAPGPGPGRPDEITARFKMTALELTADARKIMERALAASGAPAPSTPAPVAPLALPVPTRVAETSLARDPFSFGPPPARPPGRRAPPAAGRPAPAGPPAAAPAEPPKPKPPMEVKGIVSFPGGYLAIVNNQIVKVGDTVSGHRVERITDNAVVLREPDGGQRTETLPGLVVAPAPGSGR